MHPFTMATTSQTIKEINIDAKEKEITIQAFRKASPDAEARGTEHVMLNWSRSVKKHKFTIREIFELFHRFGKIQYIVENDGARRVAAVTFETVESAMEAKKCLHGQSLDVLDGRVLHVTCAIRIDLLAGKADMLRTRNVPMFRPIEEGPIENIIPGLFLHYGFVTESEEQEIMKSLDEDNVHEWNAIITRRVRHFGYEFNYKNRRCDETEPLNNMTAMCEDLINRLPSPMPVCDQITANEYIPGQGIADHIDTHSAFEDGIASLSLCGVVVMEFKHPDGRHISIALPQRSLLILSGAARYEWTHGIMSRKTDLIDGQQVSRQRRVSLSFRKLHCGPCECDFRDQCDSRAAQAAEKGASEGFGPTLMEKKYVHEFYDKVADHFSCTRYKPWPKVEEFVKAFPEGSLIADIGCGNGKYMKCIQTGSFAIGGDRCEGLVNICQKNQMEAMRLDALVVPLRSNVFDAVLSIAVFHHLSTRTHRMKAMEEVIRLMRPGGSALIYAWAQEQNENSRRKFDLHKQDIIVPWNLEKRFQDEQKDNDEVIVNRYCHVFYEGELDEMAMEFKQVIIEDSYYDESNWCLKLRKREIVE